MPVSDQGQFTNRFKAILRALIFSTHEDKVLLIKGGQHKRLWAGMYNGIGGHIESGEDVLSAAKREFTKETGIELTDIWLCGIIMIDTKTNPGILVFVFRGVFPELPVALDLPTKGHQVEGICEWIPISSIYKLPLVEDLPVILPRILAAQRENNPFYAIYAYDERDRLVIKMSEDNI